MGLFEDTIVGAKNAFNSAKKITGDAVDVQKMKIEISALKSSISDTFKELGKFYYDQTKAGRQDNEILNALIDDIDKKKLNLEELRLKLAVAKGQKICKDCNYINPADGVYCCRCGKEL